MSSTQDPKPTSPKSSGRASSARRSCRDGDLAADPGGPIEAVKETSATLKSVLSAAESGDHGELVAERTKETADKARVEHKNPLSGCKPTGGANAGVEIVDELRGVNAILSPHGASPKSGPEAPAIPTNGDQCPQTANILRSPHTGGNHVTTRDLGPQAAPTRTTENRGVPGSSPGLAILGPKSRLVAGFPSCR
jgi:hypothetical protein